MAIHASTLGLDQSDHSSAIVANVPAVFATRSPMTSAAPVLVSAAALDLLEPERSGRAPFISEQIRCLLG